VGPDKGSIPNGGTQELEVTLHLVGPLSVAKQAVGEVAMQGSNVRGPSCNQLTLGQVQGQTNGCCPGFDQAESAADRSNIPSQNPIIEVVDCNVQASVAKVAGKRLDCYRKQERA
jgi:hypothetical protein